MANRRAEGQSPPARDFRFDHMYGCPKSLQAFPDNKKVGYVLAPLLLVSSVHGVVTNSSDAPVPNAKIIRTATSLICMDDGGPMGLE